MFVLTHSSNIISDDIIKLNKKAKKADAKKTRGQGRGRGQAGGRGRGQSRGRGGVGRGTGSVRGTAVNRLKAFRGRVGKKQYTGGGKGISPLNRMNAKGQAVCMPFLVVVFMN